MSASEDIDIPPLGYRGYRYRADPLPRRMVFVAGGLAAALSLVIAAVFPMPAARQQIPVITPPPGPMKVRPRQPGGLTPLDPSLAGWAAQENGADRLAPLPETPNPQALNAVMVGPAPASPALPAFSASAAPPKAAVPALPLPPAPPTVLAAATAGTEPPAQLARGGLAVQLAALASESAAETEWQLLASRLPSLFTGMKPTIMQAMVDGKTYWRLRTGHFSSIAAASEFCAQVESGGGHCSIATF